MAVPDQNGNGWTNENREVEEEGVKEREKEALTSAMDTATERELTTYLCRL